MNPLKSFWLIAALLFSFPDQAQVSGTYAQKKNQFQFGTGIQYGNTLLDFHIGYLRKVAGTPMNIVSFIQGIGKSN